MNTFRTTIIVTCAMCALLSACDENRDQKRVERGSAKHALIRGDAESLENSRKTAVEALRSRTYENVRHPSRCADDCADHNAGFAWAKRNGIFDEGACIGSSNAFIEGCKAYGEEVEKRAAEFEVSKESE